MKSKEKIYVVIETRIASYDPMVFNSKDGALSYMRGDLLAEEIYANLYEYRLVRRIARTKVEEETVTRDKWDVIEE